MDLIKTLVHELAHTWDMDHSPDHGAAEARMLASCMRKLRRDGYVSEEAELGYR